MRVIIGIIWYFVFSLALFRISAQQRSNYGEYCNSSLRCDTGSFLTCRNHSCDCYKLETMVYDPDVKSCLVLVGEKCRYLLRNGDNRIEDDSSRSRGFEEELDCVQNAWCNRAGNCVCSEDYIEINNGTCITQRNFEETCSTDRECRQDRFLNCINGKCLCNETLSTYNNLLRQCVGKAGQQCIGIDACVYNADCTASAVSRYGKGRTNQYMKLCSCNPGFIADSSGLCKVGIGGQCSSSKPCASSFKCKDGQCVCKFENVQLAMIRSQTCLSLVGGPCNETRSELVGSSNATTFETFSCVDNANCELTGNTLYECQCNDGFVANRDGTCDLAFGMECDSNPKTLMSKSQDDSFSPYWKPALICDRNTPLFCVNGLCQCESSLYAFDGSGACLGKYGAPCKLALTSENDQGLPTSKFLCIPGAHCVGTRESAWPFGKCVCSPGFTVTNNRTCSNSTTSH